MAFQQGNTYNRPRDGEASQVYVALVVADPDACMKCSQCVEHCYQEAIELRPCAAHGEPEQTIAVERMLGYQA